MRFLVFDTETTGFVPGSICQLSYIMADSQSASATGRNYFFTVDYVEPGAVSVHGYTAAALKKLSGGRRFDFHSEDILNDFKAHSLWVAHNYNFDKKFIFSEFNNIGKTLKPKRTFCTMTEFTSLCNLKFNSYSSSGNKKPKLEELVKYFNVTDKMISLFASKTFNNDKIGFHDARYDCAATYLCFQKAIDQGLVTNL